jgi:hypothetical protein
VTPAAARTIVGMSVDHHALLAALVEREEREPGQSLDGRDLMQRFQGLTHDDPRPWETLVRAAAQLRRVGWIDWRYMLWPKDEGREPQPQFIDQQKIQQVQDIVVNERGLAAHASRRQAQVATTQIDVVNSSVGQLAAGDIHNITVAALLNAVEAAIDSVDATSEVKEEARGVIRRMRSAATSVVSSAASGVLAAALRHSLGLP